MEEAYTNEKNTRIDQRREGQRLWWMMWLFYCFWLDCSDMGLCVCLCLHLKVYGCDDCWFCWWCWYLLLWLLLFCYWEKINWRKREREREKKTQEYNVCLVLNNWYWFGSSIKIYTVSLFIFMSIWQHLSNIITEYPSFPISSLSHSSCF